MVRTSSYGATQLSWCAPCAPRRSEEHTSELQSHLNLVCRLLLEKKKNADVPRLTDARSRPPTIAGVRDPGGLIRRPPGFAGAVGRHCGASATAFAVPVVVDVSLI